MDTNWQAQAETEVKRWVEAQRAWWEQVVRGQRANGPQDQGNADPASAAIDGWREAAYRVVDAQAQALLAMLAQPAGPGLEEALSMWTNAQRTMWQDWLGAAGGLPAAAGAEPGRRLVEALREAAEHLVHSQADWAKAWMAAESQAEPPGGP